MDNFKWGGYNNIPHEVNLTQGERDLRELQEWRRALARSYQQGYEFALAEPQEGKGEPQ